MVGFIPVGHQKFILLQFLAFTPTEWSANTDLIKSTIFFILQIFKSFLLKGWVNNFYLLKMLFHRSSLLLVSLVLRCKGMLKRNVYG